MALSHLLDTSVYCQPIKLKPIASVQERWAALGDDVLAISTLCDAEVLYGLELKKSRRLNSLYEALLKDKLQSLPVDYGVASHFASLKAWAKPKGHVVSDLDLLIAATARTHGLILATLNYRHFHGLPDLIVEDWGNAS